MTTSLGGRCERRKPGVTFEGTERIKLKQELWTLNFVRQSNVIPEKENAMVIFETHMDEITKVPDKFGCKVYGSSESCDVEIMISSDERIFCLQGHPEYPPDFYILFSTNSLIQEKGLENNEVNQNELKEWVEKK